MKDAGNGSMEPVSVVGQSHGPLAMGDANPGLSIATSDTNAAAPLAIRLRGVRKEYKLYNGVGEQTLDVLGLSALRFWRHPATSAATAPVDRSRNRTHALRTGRFSGLRWMLGVNGAILPDGRVDSRAPQTAGLRVYLMLRRARDMLRRARDRGNIMLRRARDPGGAVRALRGRLASACVRVRRALESNSAPGHHHAGRRQCYRPPRPIIRAFA